MAEKIYDAEDLNAVKRVLDSGNLSSTAGGTLVREFEEKVEARYDVRHAIATNSCQAALQYGLMAAGVGAGDEVVCDAISPFGAYAALYCHARPVFADVDPSTYNMSPQSLRDRITARTKAIALVHWLGAPAPMEEIMAVARSHQIPVIEDCAHALLAEYRGKLAGTFGLAGAMSFQQSKNMTTGDGGMVLTNDPQVGAEIRRMIHFGNLTPRLCWNFRMNEVTGAVGAVQFGRAERYVEEDRRSARLYEVAIQGHRCLQPQEIQPESTHSYHIWSAVFRGEDGERGLSELQAVCKEEGAQIGVGYLNGSPIYLQPLFLDGIGKAVWGSGGAAPYRRGYCPNAEEWVVRRIGVTISVEGFEWHRRNAEAFGRALNRLERQVA